MNTVFVNLIGVRVTIESIAGDGVRFTDEDILEAADDHWLRIRKDNGDVMCFPARAIRFVKTR